MKPLYMGILFGAIIIACFGSAHTAFAEDNAAGNNKKIVVIIDSQILLAMDGTKIIYEYDVVTGRPKKETHPDST